MRDILFSIAALAAVALIAPPVQAAVSGCVVCTCADGAVLCLDSFTETQAEQGPCAGPCDSIGSSFGSIDVTETACEDLPACDRAQTPVASPLWLGGATVALMLFGGLSLRRLRSTAS
jgi:hypothetical protein